MEKKRRWRAQRFFSSDLTLELLLRLPAKSLWRFRCVCKSWCDLISDPNFGKRHRARSLPNPALLTCSSSMDDHDEGQNVTFDISLFDSEGTLVRKFAKRGPCHKSSVVSTCRDLIFTSSFVCNLTTQEVVITLPPSYYGLALGHVPSTGEFKVLALELPVGLGRYKVLTLGTHQWRDWDAPPSFGRLRGTFANGAFHVIRVNYYIDSFNLEREEWGVLAPPPLTHPNYNLRELSGYLCLLDGDDANNHVDIWLLKDYDKGWVKEYTICLSTLNAKQDWVAFNPLLIQDDGRLVVQVDDFSLQLYDPKTKSSREIQHFEKIEGVFSLHVKCFSSLGHRACS